MGDAAVGPRQGNMYRGRNRWLVVMGQELEGAAAPPMRRRPGWLWGRVAAACAAHTALRGGF